VLLNTPAPAPAPAPAPVISPIPEPLPITGRINNDPNNLDRQKLLTTGVLVAQASEHAEYAKY
jgi:hypothetical protein